ERTPAEGAGLSIVTLSVSSSTSGSSTATCSPAFLNQRPMVASVTDSPSVGTRISVMSFVQRFVQRFVHASDVNANAQCRPLASALSQRLVQQTSELDQML